MPALVEESAEPQVGQGRALLPVLQEICRWGNKVLPGTWVPPERFMKMKP
jgi:hypothetical protein